MTDRVARPRSRVLAALVTVCLSLAAFMIAGSLATAQPVAEAPPEKVQQLIKLLDDPEIKAWLATKPPSREETAGTAASAEISSWDEAIRNHLVKLREAVPRVPGEAANAVWTVRMEINDYGFVTIVLLFGALLALGFGAEWLLRRSMRVARRYRPDKAKLAAPEPNRAARLLSELAPIAVFSTVSAGVFLVFQWPALLRVVILSYLVALIGFRITIALARVLLSPEGGFERPEGAEALRLIAVDDARARFWYRRLVVFFAYLMAAWATVSLLPRLGFSVGVAELISYLLGIGLLALAIEMVWRRPRAAANEPRTNIANWLLTIFLVALWGCWIAGLNGTFWLGIYALLLPKALAIAGQAAQSLAVQREVPGSAKSVRTVLIVRGSRALVVLLAVLWFGLVLSRHPGTMVQDALANQVMRGLLHGAIILLAADLFWHVTKAYIDRNLEVASGDDAASVAEAARRARLRTLLPIFRNMLAILIAVVAILMVLAGLGVQIGPLIAGAGIFGVAIGFGAQTLVKDVISGILYMMDDAFRVGDYIQSGNYKGTVESFSLRSVRLRHHRGPVFTVPFGVLGAVQNMSRDWVIEKFKISVPIDTDVVKVKKLVKGIGAQLLEDPDLAPNIIETVKMKGVEQFNDFGMELSFAVMTRPGQQTAVKRRAQTMMRDAFMANGIEFAHPTVHVGSDISPAAAAAAASTLSGQKAAATG